MLKLLRSLALSLLVLVTPAAAQDRVDKAAEENRFSAGIKPGRARPSRHRVPKAAFSMTSNSQNRRQPGIVQVFAAGVGGEDRRQKGRLAFGPLRQGFQKIIHVVELLAATVS